MACEVQGQEDKHEWKQGRGRLYCGKCLLPSHSSRPSRKRLRERCPGRSNCLAEHAHQWSHDILESRCQGTPLHLCGTCGAWSEYMVRSLGKVCKGSRPKRMRTSLKRLMIEGRHPLTNQELDYEPRAYTYDAEIHGPSRHTIAVRRLVRRKLARIEPWAELQEEPPMQARDNSAEDSNFPSAEDEAEFFFAQERYFDELDSDPFSFEDGVINASAEDDAEGFWESIPAPAPVETAQLQKQADITQQEKPDQNLKQRSNQN